MSLDATSDQENARAAPTIFILSGGVGASGEQIVNTALAQFPGNKARTCTIGNIRLPEQISRALAQAHQVGGLVVYTLVDDSLCRQLVEEARAMNVQTIDLMSPLLDWLSEALNQKPAREPGRYRQLHREYYDRVAAINYTLAHDDGQNAEDWPQAEIMLVGVSRAGKTPLSVYLSVLGWKVANFPLVPEIPVPPALFELDPARVVGLTLAPEQLLMHRRQRQSTLGVKGGSDYADLESIEAELQQARKVFREGHFHIVNMTDKTIEHGADEIIRKLAGSL